MSFNVKTALGGFGWLVAAIMGVSGLLVGEQAKPVERAEEVIASSPSAFSCPSGYEQTNGTDPDTQGEFMTCDNGRYIVTKRDGANAVAFDTLTGKFVDVESLP